MSVNTKGICAGDNVYTEFVKRTDYKEKLDFYCKENKLGIPIYQHVSNKISKTYKCNILVCGEALTSKLFDTEENAAQDAAFRMMTHLNQLDILDRLFDSVELSVSGYPRNLLLPSLSLSPSPSPTLSYTPSPPPSLNTDNFSPNLFNSCSEYTIPETFSKIVIVDLDTCSRILYSPHEDSAVIGFSNNLLHNKDQFKNLCEVFSVNSINYNAIIVNIIYIVGKLSHARLCNHIVLCSSHSFMFTLKKLLESDGYIVEIRHL